MGKTEIIALDLDGTLTQHKQPLPEKNRAVLTALRKKYRLLMVGAGQVRRIFNQMEHFPVDIIGNYGLQYARYNHDTREMDMVRDLTFPCDRQAIEERVTMLREKYGYTDFAGDSVEYHASGCITFPILGTAAVQEDKLAFDPDRRKRRRIYGEVAQVFSDYRVFVGGSSSFDMAPVPYDKYYALAEYCRENEIEHENVIYIGDDYGPGGNDRAVYESDFPYLTIDDYLTFPDVVRDLL